MNTEELKTYAGLFGSMNDILRYLAQGNENDLLVKYLSTSQEYAYYYARYVIKGRWPPGENTIAKNPRYACHYATIVINDRFPKGESAIAKVPALAYQYARYVIKGRWPPGEKAIAKDSGYSYFYANRVIKDRFARYKFLCMASFYKFRNKV